MTDRSLVETVSRNRTFIMGCAMISILLFHQFFIPDDSASGFIWKTFHYFGHWGVDVFLFVSGFGVQYSLRKNSTSVYYVNRIVRLLPQCIIVGAILGTLHLFGIGGYPIYGTDSLFCIFSSLWLWYIEAVILYYIAAPYVLDMIDRMKWMAVLLIASVCVAMLFVIGKMDDDTFLLLKCIPWIVARSPVFVLGMFVATQYFRIPIKWILSIGAISLVLAALLRIMQLHGAVKIEWIYVFVAMAMPAVCYILGLVGNFASEKHLDRPIKWCGEHSLELYMLQWPVYNFCWDLFPNTPKPLVFIIALAAIAVIALILKTLCKWITDRLYQ